ncbi:hypothetical protein [Azospirillum canadense]|uniref:hypothetical protein n=1 Tax=Azospirillum canadense TaxID=403962 RepID=UPI0022277A4B|nr:hypothetical protein [Azospirillum canadense]MCW2241061.1 hypothetical protein [Azospirillum canadense]
MPDLHDTASQTPLLNIPEALTSEAAAMLLGGNVGGLKAVQAKLAAALADQGLPGSDAGRAAEGWVRSFAAGMENAASPDAAIAEANRITAGAAARMAQALQDSSAMTGEQRLATALAQGQGVEQAAAGARGSTDLKSDLSRALFDGVMAPPAGPAGSAHPTETLSRALTQPVDHGLVPPQSVEPSPIEKLTAALASGVAVPEAVKAVAPDGAGLFAATLERALSSGEDAASAVAAATERTAQGGVQSQAATVEQSDGDRLLSSLAVGGSAAARGVGDGAAFSTVLGDTLAHGSSPDAALGASARAQADMTARVSAAGVAPKPADTLLASLASGRDVAETVKSFAVATGIDPKAAGGFSQALGNALSSGQEATGALSAAHQDAFAATAIASAAAQGVKGNSLVAALASGQNVQQAVQALGGSGGAFSAALGQALAEGRSPGQALAAARQSADTVQRNSQSSEVPISPENKALADLATPGAAEKAAAADGAKTDKTADADSASKESAKDGAKDGGDGKDAKAEGGADTKGAEQVADNGEKGADKSADKDGAKDDAKDGKDAAGGKAADGSAPSDSPAPDAPSPNSASASKSAGMASAALTPVTIAPPDSGSKSGSPADSGGRSTATSAAQPASTSPISKVGTTDPFTTTAQTQQRVAQSLARLAETTTPPVAEHHVPAPTVAAGFDAATLAKALAVAEDTAAPAGFTVFHLIEAMFRPGETGSNVVGVAVVANAGSSLGVWQYSVDGATWVAVGAVSDAAALLLPGTALLRFLPAADAFGTAPALGLRAVNEGWTEGFSDSAHRLFALGATGGTSPLSAEIAQVSLDVTPVNDAPVATGTAVSMAASAEDATDPAGATVTALVGALFSDAADAGSGGSSANGFAGVAVVGNAASAAQGAWQYWTGSAWTAVGSVSEGSALLLSADAKLRFVPAGDWNGTTPALTVRLVDDSQGTLSSGGRVNLGTGVGGATAYSAGTIALTGTIAAVNDAPVATGTTATMAAIAEDTANPAGATVTTLFGTLFSDAVDAVSGGSVANRFAGIAVVANAASAAQGVWQYWTGSTWATIGAVSNGNALLLAADAKLRFVPAADWNGTTPALTVRLVDDSAGVIASGNRVDLTAGVGGTTAYSAETVALTGTVSAVNDAPVATGTAVAMAAIAEDAADPAGAAVSTLFSSLFSDTADAVTGGSSVNGFAGVAIVGNMATAAQGEWQYWTGSAWVSVGTVSEGSALVVAAADKLRFVPAANWNGTTPALTVRLIDDSQGTLSSGDRVNLSASAGGTTAYSAETIALTGAVIAVNDAPVATGTAATLPTIAEDTANPAGATVTALFGALFSDAADAVSGGSVANGFAGIAVIANAASAAQGVWQYWTGSAWAAVGSVSGGNALLLAADAKLRFVPAADWNGTTPALTARLVDDSAGGITSGDQVDLTTGVGGTTASSAGTVDLTGAVAAVNDAPVATGTAVSKAAISEDAADPAGATIGVLFGALFSDAADAVSGGSAANGFAGVAIVGNAATAAQGVWQYWTGSNWVAVGAVSDGSALLLAADTKLRFVPAANWNGTTPALTARLVDASHGALSSGDRTDLSTGVGGTTPYSAGTIALTGTITAVNDAPVALGTSATMAAIAEDAANPAGAMVSSLFGSLFSDAADAVSGGSAANGFAGVAIVGNAASAAQGVWQYWIGSAWTAVGAVSNGSALLLAADAKLRFVPASNWNGTTPALTVRLVDDSAGDVINGGRVNLVSLGVGGATAYSAGTIALTGSVTAVNDAPVATGAFATMAAVAEDTANPAGATVSALFGSLFSDTADAVAGGSVTNGFAGIAIVGNAASTAQGTWQYWTGSAWTAVGSVSNGSALLLSTDAKLRFVPAANWNGTTPALTVRLVDDSQGTPSSGDRVDLGAGIGGTSAYSAGTIALTGAVTAVNDAPVATGTTATMTAIAEDTANPAGATITTLFGALFSDTADAVAGGSSANGFAGVAIVGNAASTAQGVWQYWTGTAWAAVGTVSEGFALVVAAADKLRFVPAANWNGTTPALTVRLVEQSAASVASGAHLDLTGGVGGSTPYSAGTIALTGSVTAVNDAPQLTVSTASLTTLKGNAVAVTGLSVSDIDAGSTPLLVTLTAAHGALTLTNTASDAVITGNGTGSVTILATLATLNSLLAAADGLLYFAGPYSGPDTISIVVNDQAGGGAGGALTASGTIGVTVVPPNASPVLKDTDLQLTVAAEALAAPVAGTAGFAVSKLVGLNGGGVANVTDNDKEAVTGIALIGTNESYGHWWYSTDNGATWKLVGAVNDSDSALLLRPTDRLYFQPNASVPGTVSGALTIRAWDQTSGTYGTKVAVDHTDGSAFSAATDSLTLHPGVLLPNGSFDSGLTGWTSTGGASVGTTGDGHEGTLTSATGQTPTQLEDFLGVAHGSIAAATGTIPSYGNAMKLTSTVTVTKDTVLTFDWNFTFSDPGYHDFSFVSVNGVVKLLAKDASASGTFTMVIPANTTLSLGFGASDTSDNSVNPILRVDNIKLTTVASDPIVLDLTGNGLSLRPLSDDVHFDVTGDGVADQTGWIGAGNALLVRDENQNGRIDDARELVSEQFGKGFGSSLEALASLDDNHDGRIDAADLSFATLKVWQDANADGVSQGGELRTLAEAGVQSIATTATPSNATVAGNRILGTTSVTMADGSTHTAAGVAFDVKAAVSGQVQSQPTPGTTSGGTDFAAMLASGLGLPAQPHAQVVQSEVDIHGTASEWTSHDPNLHHPQLSETNGTHPSIHS